MAGRQKSGSLSERKRALLIESDLNRLMLRMEFENIRQATARLDHFMSAGRRVVPWLLPIMSAGGWVAARVARKRAHLFSAAGVALKLLVPLFKRLRR
jgi:hypothetical protein